MVFQTVMINRSAMNLYQRGGGTRILVLNTFKKFVRSMVSNWSSLTVLVSWLASLAFSLSWWRFDCRWGRLRSLSAGHVLS